MSRSVRQVLSVPVGGYQVSNHLLGIYQSKS